MLHYITLHSIAPDSFKDIQNIIKFIHSHRTIHTILSNTKLHVYPQISYFYQLNTKLANTTEQEIRSIPTTNLLIVYRDYLASLLECINILRAVFAQRNNQKVSAINNVSELYDNPIWVDQLSRAISSLNKFYKLLRKYQSAQLIELS